MFAKENEMNVEAVAGKKERLFCLDALRGLDMLLLCVVQPLAVALIAWHGGAPDWLREQFSHPSWGGFTLHDQIMPCFIFMSGAAVPLALARYLDGGRPTVAFWKHIALRVATLWVLGMFIQGNIVSLDIMKIKPYSNTLQAIASGYLVSALALLVPARSVRFALPFVLAGVYTLLLELFGDMTPTGNFAQIVGQKFVRALGFPEGAQAYATGNYTWLLTSLMFAAMALWGSCCTEIVRSRLPQGKRAMALFALAAALTAIGFTAQIWIAPVKQIFALSFTARSMGVCIAALGVLYVVTDIWKLRRGWWLVTLFGQCALACYVIRSGFGDVLNAFCKRLLSPGIESMMSPEAFRVVTALAVGAALTAVLVVRRRLRG